MVFIIKSILSILDLSNFMTSFITCDFWLSTKFIIIATRQFCSKRVNNNTCEKYCPTSQWKYSSRNGFHSRTSVSSLSNALCRDSLRPPRGPSKGKANREDNWTIIKRSSNTLPTCSKVDDKEGSPYFGWTSRGMKQQWCVFLRFLFDDLFYGCGLLL